MEKDAAISSLVGALLNEASLVETVTEWVRDNLAPGDVFERAQLEAWARAAGWTLP